MIRYIELIEPFDQNGYVPNSVMASSPNGDWVLYSEAQAEIDALKAERDALLAALESAEPHLLGYAGKAVREAIAKARGES